MTFFSIGKMKNTKNIQNKLISVYNISIKKYLNSFISIKTKTNLQKKKTEKINIFVPMLIIK